MAELTQFPKTNKELAELIQMVRSYNFLPKNMNTGRV